MSKATKLSDKEQLRYSRHILLGQIAEQGQLKLKNSHVLIVGVGGLGCPAAQYLAASGVGKLTLVEHDHIELSNLQRQILYKTNHIKRAKAEVAQAQLLAANPEIQVEIIKASALTLNLTQLFSTADIVLDCTDNTETRYAINAACVASQTPLVSAAATAGAGQLMVFDFNRDDPACYQCVFPQPESSKNEPEQQINCSNAGVISPLLGVMGSLQALETLKLLLAISESSNKLLMFDAWQTSFNQIKLNKDPMCSCCAKP